MRLWFLGVRGSSPASGPQFLRYGGRTSCLAIAHDGHPVPQLILDAGTGLPAVTALLDGAAFSGSILLTHLHWDHVQGLPFFAGGDRTDSRVTVHLPAQAGLSGRDLLAQLMSPPAFPISPEQLRGDWRFIARDPGSFSVDGVAITAAEIEHKGGRTFGYRVEADGASITYLPDHAVDGAARADTVAFVRRTDVLVHDAQFFGDERNRAVAFGHATVADAVALAEAASVGRLVLVHHAPTRTDNELDTAARALDPSAAVVFAHEGLVIDVAGLQASPTGN